MKDIRVIKGKFYLQSAIAEGEHEHQDFKYSISDARKIARSLSAFANNSGGQLLIGVKDNGVIAGVRNEEDIYVVEQAAMLYCRPPQQLEFTALRAEEGAVVIRATIQASPTRPVQAQEPDGRWQAYYRVADENIVATPIMVKAWRRKASDEPTTLTLNDGERSLVTLLSNKGMLSVEELARGAHLSIATTTDIITRLYTLDIVTFRFSSKREFVVALAED